MVLYGAYSYILADAFRVKRFRSTHNITISKEEDVNLAGLEDLRISGSNRPVFSDLKDKLKHVKGKIYLVDLTGGEQIYYKGIYPLEFLGRSERNQKHFINKLRRFLVNGFAPFKEEDFVSESVLAHQHGFEYIQLYNHRGYTPEDQLVDKIIKIINSVEPDDWIHFHCSAGRGRTTMAMVLTDIIKNGKKVPVDHIVRRAHLMGGENLFNTEVWANGTYTKETLERRKHRIIEFHEYVNDPEGYGKRDWVEWCHLNNKGDVGDKNSRPKAA